MLAMRRLLTHLAQFSSFFKQGEVLCTQGLAYLLKNSAARAEFGAYISKHACRTLGSNLAWKAEVRQEDGGRCDLEACAANGSVIKIEAKLGAPFGEGQLGAYAANIQKRCDGGLLLVLVPRHRTEEIIASVSSTFALTGNGPWRLGGPPGCSVAVIYWEDVLDVLRPVGSEPFHSDLDQFEAMYRVLKGRDIEPPTNDSELLAWRDKQGNYFNLVDRVTRQLSPHGQVLPMAGCDSTAVRPSSLSSTTAFSRPVFRSD
jgi:hypothetical protein